jgi:hypothetical protein
MRYVPNPRSLIGANSDLGREWPERQKLDSRKSFDPPPSRPSVQQPHLSTQFSTHLLVFRNGSSYVDRLDQARCREAEHSCSWYVVCAMRLCAQLTSAIVRPDNTHRNRSLCPLRLRWSRLLLRYPRWPYSCRCVCLTPCPAAVRIANGSSPDARPSRWQRRSKVGSAKLTVRSVKTRIQLDPVTYNRGLIGGFRQIIAKDGAGALLTGFGPTAAGYFLQGAFKFGGYEFFKQQSINLLGYETAQKNRTAVYLASAGCAEFFADIALCPLEATRIRLVSEPTFANGLIGGFTKILKTEGIGAFYSGFGPILFKQYVFSVLLRRSDPIN